MAIKKYLSLEEAAAMLKIKGDELIRLREKGDVRGFADRGTWKFKAEDIEELQRRRQPDSNPEVPFIDEDDEVGRQPTVITKGRGGVSDSDVRIVPEDRMRSKLAGSSAEITATGDSDSDVRLTGAKPQTRPSDSDVQLVTPKGDSGSDVTLADSDSDVRLAPLNASDSDVKLVERGGKKSSSDSDVALLPRGDVSSRKEPVHFDHTGSDSVLLDDSAMPLGGDSVVRLGGESSTNLLGGGSGSLAGAADSGILLEGAGHSGFPLGGDSSAIAGGSDSAVDDDEDSGITLGGDSGIQLSGESGIRLEADSGIRLTGDSGIRLSDAPKKGKKPAKTDDDLDSAVPLLLSGDAGRTDVEVPMLDEDDSEVATLNLPSDRKKKGKGDTSVVMFEDEDSGAGLESSDELGYDSDLGGADDELEVAEDILGEDEDLEQLEVFDSDDSVFDENFVEGGSSAAMPAFSGKIQVAPEVEWGSGTMALLICSTLFLVMGSILSVDLLRIVWGSANPNTYQGELIGVFAGLFK